jgi:toxin FitB
MYLVDTNVLSESTKLSPDARILSWWEDNERLIRISVVSIGEIHYGIELLDKGRKQTELRKWFEVLRTRFAESILPFDDAVALKWGSLKASLDRQGRKLPAIDSLLAATATWHTT